MLLMSDFTRFSIAIPPRNPGSKQIGGTAFGTDPPPDEFPDSNPDGASGPFEATPRPTPDGNPAFDDWVNYYVLLVGSAVERLNGLQFNLREDNLQDQAGLMSEALGKLADALNVGGPTSNVPQLRWPLAGSYTISQNTDGTGFGELTVDLYFDTDPDYRLVVNCTIQVTAKSKGQIIVPESGSSSYIATSG